MPYKDTVDDFNLKWGSTFALHNGELVYVYGAQYEEDEESTTPQYYVALGHLDKSKTKEYGMDLESLTPILVDSQFFNCVDLDGPSSIDTKRVAAMLYSRNPRRQNKRSISSDNATVDSVFQNLLGKLSPKWRTDYALTAKHVQALLGKQYPSYLDALDYCKKHVAVALSPDFAIGLSPLEKDGYIVASKFGFIGTADAEAIYVKHKGSMQEVIDFVSRKQIRLRVVDATKSS